MLQRQKSNNNYYRPGPKFKLLNNRNKTQTVSTSWMKNIKTELGPP